MNPSPVRVRRDGKGSFTATNARGAEVVIGRPAEGQAFSPVELLMAAIAACAGLSAEGVIARRLGEDAPVTLNVTAEKDEEANRLSGVRVSLDLDLSDVDDAAREALATTIMRAVERACTVSRTVEAPGVRVELVPVNE
ncbi:putative OsmC-related protein [Streptoalloteichus tenebrarius]|uniref:OsmC-related protein n=1 Tax=Streptoalloteichus tenebrarius (strain ATCC 17920 / DSM 40477 / JCM 4838 / CBS 697.72 / NBRC 16177 / NCIMB 11028 / NRRL B-12390 / A12253. 1 / ISP 5477) TaxID=1933 RepID=A0ABT1HYZ0_STRSD|nr:OsmC family protein [Streptoalloteichus tenebrarius]MCP2260728.1 putative OsmC-related protein [Streptoalloteichus tenebrarius]BFF03738.1 OsmC family protein [Streptoalloteichus tenebrarius]